MSENRPIVISNRDSGRIVIRQEEDGWYCDLPSIEDGSPVIVAVTVDFFQWFLQTSGQVVVDEAFQFAMDQGGDIFPVFLYKVPPKS